MSEPDEIADYWADWLVDAVGMATQNRALLRGDPTEDEVLTEAILLNGKKAILNVAQPMADRIEALEAALRLIVDYHAGGPQTASYIQGIALAALAPERK